MEDKNKLLELNKLVEEYHKLACDRIYQEGISEKERNFISKSFDIFNKVAVMARQSLQKSEEEISIPGGKVSYMIKNHIVLSVEKVDGKVAFYNIALPFRTTIKGSILYGTKYLCPEKERITLTGWLLLKYGRRLESVSYVILNSMGELAPVNFQHQHWGLCTGDLRKPEKFESFERIVEFRDELQKSLEWINLDSSYGCSQDSPFKKYDSPKENGWEKVSAWDLTCAYCGARINPENQRITCEDCGAEICQHCVHIIGEHFYCADCADDHMVCTMCGEEIDPDSNYHRCHVCGRYICEDCEGFVTVDREILCDSCVNEYTQCHDCGDYVRNEDYVTINAGIDAAEFCVCPECASSGEYIECDECHYLYEPSMIFDALRNGEQWNLCEQCYHELGLDEEDEEDEELNEEYEEEEEEEEEENEEEDE